MQSRGSYAKFFEIARGGRSGFTVLDRSAQAWCVMAWIDAILHLAADEAERRELLAGDHRRMLGSVEVVRQPLSEAAERCADQT